MSELALLGGKKAVTMQAPEELFKWPIVTKEDEDAVLEVLRKGTMSGTDVTQKFEREFAEWMGQSWALGFCNGTAAIQAAMFAVGLGEGDEMILPSLTYWASCMQIYTMRATPVFCEVDPNTLCLDPDDLERCIGPKTKAILVVHYVSHPAPMDRIMAIARKHNIKVIEDVSHAQGGLYKGRKLGTFGDVAAMSLMSGKSFAIGEAGILTTDNREIYERAVAYAHYERFTEANTVAATDLRPYAQLALGGIKGRMNQLSSAMGRVQLKYYDERCAEIRKAMNYFWDKLEGVPGIRALRVDESEGSNMAGWYCARGLYRPEELGGLSVTRFCEAVRAEGVGSCTPGCNNPLHSHPAHKTLDLYHEGEPTRIAHADRDVRSLDDALTISEGIGKTIYAVPWFKKFMPEYIDQYVEAYRKVALNYKELLVDDKPDAATIGQWYFYKDKDEDK